jgi:hypothetical protein
MGPIPPSGYAASRVSQNAAGGGLLSVTAPCPAGTLAIAGGYTAYSLQGVVTDALVHRAAPLVDFSGYRVDAYRPTGWSLYVTAVCVNALAL